MPRISIRWMLPHGKKTMGRKHHQKQPLKKDYGYIKEKLISSIHKGITIAEIKGRDKSPFFRFARHGRALTGVSPEHAQIVGSV